MGLNGLEQGYLYLLTLLVCTVDGLYVVTEVSEEYSASIFRVSRLSMLSGGILQETDNNSSWDWISGPGDDRRFRR
jgi:hypothetical protein